MLPNSTRPPNENLKIRTLEKALELGFDEDRIPSGLNEVGIDRGDFIDLAFVSKQVPGKSPTQVKYMWSLSTRNYMDSVGTPTVSPFSVGRDTHLSDNAFGLQMLLLSILERVHSD